MRRIIATLLIAASLPLMSCTTTAVVAPPHAKLVYVEGRWVAAPRANAVWVSGHWERRHGFARVWVPGHWRG